MLKISNLPLLALFALYLAISSGKVILTQSSPYYSAEDETNLHFTENAVQYRYAKMIAEGRGIPEVDTRIQHPEGVRVAEELTLTLERVSGSLYRLLNAFGYDVPFHVYTVYFIAFFSSLAIFPLYGVATRLWGGWQGGILVISFYTVMPPAWMRSITSFSREDFTLPFLFAGLACFGLSQTEARERWLPWAAGVTLSLAAISWHITNFVLVLLFAYAIAVYFLCPDERKTVFDAFWPILLLLFLAGIFSDLLRNKGFIISTTMLVGYGLLAAHLVGEKFGLGRYARLGILASVPVIAHLALSGWIVENQRAYSHAFDVIYYKLRFGLIKPEDPTLMTYDARGMWSSSFRSPTPGSIWTMFSTLLIVSGGAAYLATRDLFARRLPRSQRFFLICFFAFLAGYIAFDRLQVFFVFFAALLSGRWLIAFPNRKQIAVLGLCAFIGYEIYNDTRLYITIHRAPGLPGLIRWIRENTEEDDVILAAFHISPSILTYTGRPVVLHPKFESHIIREKSQRFLEGLFSSEQTFFDLIRKWEADWYVYQATMGLDTSLESPRYVAGRTTVPSDSALYKFQFAAEELRHFHLVYQDGTYRIFKVRDPPETQPDITYQPVFDLAIYSPQTKTGRADSRSAGLMPTDDQIARVRQEFGDPRFRARLAAALYKEGRYRDSATEYERLVKKRPRDPDLSLAAANAIERAGRPSDAIPHYLLALRLKPELPRYRFETDNGIVFRRGARILLESGKTEDGTRWLEKAVALAPHDVEAATNLGIIYVQTNKLEKARTTFERVLSIESDYPAVYLQLGLLDQKEGHHSEAIGNMQRYLDLAPGTPDQSAVNRAILTSRDALDRR